MKFDFPLRNKLAYTLVLLAILLYSAYSAIDGSSEQVERTTASAPTSEQLSQREPTKRPTREQPTKRPTREAAASPQVDSPASELVPDVGLIDGFETIRYADLPPEAHTTLALIAQGGPFPYRQDGTVFQNRERILPRKPSGYYREYTVETPGLSHRGARRIVAGQEGELFYTDGHYESFRQVVP